MRTSNEDTAQHDANCAKQSEDLQTELDPSRNVDEDFRLRAHFLRVCVTIRKDEVAVRVLVEVDVRTFLLLLRWWRRHATSHSDSLWIERRPGGVGVNHRIPRRCVHMGLPAACHCCDGEREVTKEGSSAAHDRQNRR